MTTQAIGSSSSTSAAPTAKRKELKTEDFVKMMITQLQNQDPLDPAKNGELLAQMSQIGQLQSSTQLKETLTGLATQNRIGAAGNLIGKMIQGLDDNNDAVEGLVTSVRVETDRVMLELDSGKTLSMDRVTSIASAPAASAKAA